MRIALIGYGKMGKAIEAIALERHHEIVLKVGIENLEDFTAENLKHAEVAIEFTGPESAAGNLEKLLKLGIPVVCGSTGWLEKLDSIKELAVSSETALLYASNFSVGVNIFFHINKQLARLMNSQHEYSASISETHHTAKLDAPSGTAITLAEQIISSGDRYKCWSKQEKENALHIESLREDPAPGTHTIAYKSAIDTITITHEAHSRQGFALGAVLAAEFIRGKKGIFSMDDVLKLGSI